MRKWTDEEDKLLTSMLDNPAYLSKSGRFSARKVVEQFARHSLKTLHGRVYTLRHQRNGAAGADVVQGENSFTALVEQAKVALLKAENVHDQEIKALKGQVAYYKELSMRVAKVVEALK